jgi:hypothetical protein
MWTEILKSLPRDRSGLIEMLKNDVAFRRLIRTLGRRELKGSHFIKDFLRQVDDMEASKQLETFLTVMQNTPPTDYPLEKLKENLATLRETISYEADDLKIQIVDEGLALLDKKESGELTDAEKNRLNELHTRISTMTFPKNNAKRREQRDFNAKKKTFLRGFGGFTLTFAVPEGKQGEFEQKVGEFGAKTYEIRQGQGETNVGERSGNKLITSFLDGKEFLDFLRSNEQFKEDFTELARPFGPDLSGLGIKAREDDAKTKLQEFHARKVVFLPAQIDTITEVNDYFAIVAEIQGAKGVFMPRKVETSERIDELPASIFLLKNDANSIRARSSISQLRLNPYANRILLSGFTKDNWFEKMFESIKMDIASEEQAMNAIYDDIWRMYNKKDSQLGLNERDFADLTTLSQNEQTRRNQIKTYLERGELIGDMKDKSQELRLGRFSKDTDTLSIKEGKRIQKILDDYRKNKNISQEDFDEDFGRIRLISLNADGEESMPVKVEGEEITPVARYGISLQEPIYEEDEDGDEEFVGFEKEQRIKIGSLLEYLETTTDVDFSDFSGQVNRIREFLGRENNFQTYVESLTSEEIRQAVEAGSGSQAYMDRIDPLNSLTFLSNLNELMGASDDAGFIKETLLAIADEQEPSEKATLIGKLNDKMLPILADMREFMFKAVEDRLRTIGKDYLKLARGTQEKAILQAIEGFKEKRLLAGGE